DIRRDGGGEFTANGIKGSGGAEERVAAAQGAADPALISPVEAGAVLIGAPAGTNHEFTAGNPNRGVGKTGNQATQATGIESLANVGEENDFTPKQGEGGVQRGGLSLRG